MDKTQQIEKELKAKLTRRFRLIKGYSVCNGIVTVIYPFGRRVVVR